MRGSSESEEEIEEPAVKPQGAADVFTHIVTGRLKPQVWRSILLDGRLVWESVDLAKRWTRYPTRPGGDEYVLSRPKQGGSCGWVKLETAKGRLNAS